MCGICGIVGGEGMEVPVARAIEKMYARGPDQKGTWSDGVAHLGHCRLSIIDLSEQGRQPMVAGDDNDSIVVVFNGEIYNFAELRRELEGRYRFRSRSDTEVLVHGFRHWGLRGLLDRIRGMFAFAIWDRGRQELHLARDQCGKKPLYYIESAGRLYFASTIPAIIELVPHELPVEATAVASFLKQLAIAAPGSILKGVHKLPPAHMLTWKMGHGPVVSRYWQINYAVQDTLGVQEWGQRTETALRDAVRRRLVADVPIGAFLSGGVDSSLIVALMAQCSSQPVRTISIGFTEDSFNELPYASTVARELMTNHHQFIVKPDAVAVLPQIVFACGEPFGDQSIVPTYYVAREARRDVSVVLTGDGGDEAFAGYETARMMAVPPFIAALLGATPRFAREFLKRHDRRGGTLVRKLRWLVETHASSPAFFDPLGTRGFRGFSPGFFGPELQRAWDANEDDSKMMELWRHASGNTDVDRLLEVEFVHQLPSLFLSKIDSATMAHSLEARCPFLDREVIELAARMPASIKMPYGAPKGFLKHLTTKYVPRNAVYRPKQGFSVPLGHWFRGSLGETVERTLLSPSALARGYWRDEGVRRLFAEHRNRRADHGHRLWLLLMLELWFLMFVDRSLRPADSFQ